jgi:NlpC/P60 family putative phage cell wall peptidase
MVPVAIADACDGDVLILRMAEGSVAKHVGIRASDRRGAATIIHAYSGHGVVESPLTLSWQRRIAGVFRFSGRRG